MADRTLVGKEYPPFTWDVERGKIRELVEAIGDKNPIYTDKDAAQKAGFADMPAPPTFVTVPTSWSGIMPQLMTDMKINVTRVLYGEERYEYFGEIYPGAVLNGRMKIAGFEEREGKAGGKMHIITVEILYQDQDGKPVVKEEAVIIERV